MSETKYYINCPRCLTTGVFHGVAPVTEEEIEENPCSSCGGVGFTEAGNIDITAIMEELDYVHGKVTAIWEKVKNK